MHAWTTIGFSFVSDWLKKWRENFEPITEWSNAKPKQFANYFRHSIESRAIKATGHNLKWDHFEILASGRTNYHCKIKETLGVYHLHGKSCGNGTLVMAQRYRIFPVWRFAGPSLSRLEENNNEWKWRLHLQCREAGKSGRVGVYKWYGVFPVISVGTGKEEYVWGFPSFSETFRWNELYYLNFQPEFSVFVEW